MKWADTQNIQADPGHHLWTRVVAFRADDPAAPPDPNRQYLYVNVLAETNMCLICEQDYSPHIAELPCPGTPTAPEIPQLPPDVNITRTLLEAIRRNGAARIDLSMLQADGSPWDDEDEPEEDTPVRWRAEAAFPPQLPGESRRLVVGEATGIGPRVQLEALIELLRLSGYVR